MRPYLTLVTPPVSDPVTLDEAKQWARIDTDDDNGLISGLITSATAAAEEFLCRSLMPQTWKLTLDLTCRRDAWWDGVMQGPISLLYGDLPNAIPLPRGPASSIASVTTYGLSNEAAVFNAANYRLDASGDRLVLNYGAAWPGDIRPDAGVEIVYTAGYSTIPRSIKTGILIHVATLYEQRGACEDAMALPPGAKHLYSPYRIMAARG